MLLKEAFKVIPFNSLSGILMGETVKIDDNRVDIATLNPHETAGDSLTGGYLLKIDRYDEGRWISPFKGPSMCTS